MPCGRTYKLPGRHSVHQRSVVTAIQVNPGPEFGSMVLSPQPHPTFQSGVDKLSHIQQRQYMPRAEQSFPTSTRNLQTKQLYLESCGSSCLIVADRAYEGLGNAHSCHYASGQHMRITNRETSKTCFHAIEQTRQNTKPQCMPNASCLGYSGQEQPRLNVETKEPAKLNSTQPC